MLNAEKKVGLFVHHKDPSWSGLSLTELLEPIRTIVASDYWATQRQILRAEGRTGALLDEALLDRARIQTLGSWELYSPEFIPTVAPFVEPESSFWLAMKERPRLETCAGLVDLRGVQYHAHVVCLDRRWWQVFSEDQRLLDELWNAFPFSLSIATQDGSFWGVQDEIGLSARTSSALTTPPAT